MANDEVPDEGGTVFYGKSTDPHPWKLRYTEPYLKPDKTVGREEKVEILPTSDYHEAEIWATDFLGKGGLVFGEERYYREQVGGLFQGEPFNDPVSRKAAEEFLSRPHEYVPYEKLTPLQKRMQSPYPYPPPPISHD